MKIVLPILAFSVLLPLVVSCSQPDNSEFEKLQLEQSQNIKPKAKPVGGEFSCQANSCPSSIVMITSKKKSSKVCTGVMVSNSFLLTSSECLEDIAPNCSKTVSIKNSQNIELGCRHIPIKSKVGDSREYSYGFSLVQTVKEVADKDTIEFSNYTFNKSQNVDVWAFEYNTKNKNYELHENKFCRMSLNNVRLPFLREMFQRNISIVNCPLVEEKISGLVLDGEAKLASIVWTKVKSSKTFSHFMDKKGRDIKLANTVHCIQKSIDSIYGTNIITNTNDYTDSELNSCERMTNGDTLNDRFSDLVYPLRVQSKNTMRFSAFIDNKIRFFELDVPPCILLSEELPIRESIPAIDRFYEVGRITLKNIPDDLFEIDKRYYFQGVNYQIKYDDRVIKSIKLKSCLN